MDATARESLKRRARKLRAKGLSTREIAEKLGIGKSWAAEILNKKTDRRDNPYRNNLTAEERQRKVEGAERFAYFQAGKFMAAQGGGSPWAWRLSYKDLCQEAVLALAEAATRWNPDRGIEFLTYAGHWVRNHLLKAVISESNAGARTSGTAAPFWHCVPTASYDAPIRPDSSDPRLALMQDGHEEEHDRALDLGATAAAVEAAVATLKPDQAAAVRAVMLGGERMVDFAKRMGLPRQTVEQRLKRAMGNLRKSRSLRRLVDA